ASALAPDVLRHRARTAQRRRHRPDQHPCPGRNRVPGRPRHHHEARPKNRRRHARAIAPIHRHPPAHRRHAIAAGARPCPAPPLAANRARALRMPVHRSQQGRHPARHRRHPPAHCRYRRPRAQPGRNLRAPARTDPNMNAVFAIIGKEIRDGLRNRWVLATALLLAALALSLGLLGSAPTGDVKVDPLTVTVVSLSSLSIFLVPLIAMLLAYDAIVGEIDRGTLALLLSYPASRWQVIVGTFIGHLAILALATTAGCGRAGLALQWRHGAAEAAAWRPCAMLSAASVLLGASFLAMGYLISTLVRERATAA